jgi:hypothetical protein
MTTFTKTYNVNRMKQLIDLNGDSINFDIHFKVYSTDKKPFDLVVVDQATLDNTPILPYQKVETGEIEGQVVQDKNVFQSNYIVLKSDEPCTCVVETFKKELPKTVEQPKPKITPKPLTNNIIKTNETYPWGKILLVVLVLGIGSYFFFFYNKTEEVVYNDNNIASRSPSPIQLEQKSSNLSKSKLSKSNLSKSNLSKSNLSRQSSISSPEKGNDIINKLMSLKI